MTGKRIVAVLFIIIIFALFWWFLKESNPLIGVWESQQGQNIGLIKDNKKYQVEFTKNQLKILDKTINVGYKLEQDIVYVIDKKTTDKLKVRLLPDDRIQFTFPSIGLRRYQKK